MALRWGILATGSIGRTFAQALNLSDQNELVAVGSRSDAGATEFAKIFPAVKGHCHGSYEALLDDPDVDAIYVSTPHPEHAAWTLRALDAGKAVLCEKPMGLNHAECMAMVERARSNNQFLMEAFMYRLHPQTLEIQRLVADGAIGELRHIEASFGYHASIDADSRLFNNQLGGGGIMDVGCYPLSFARAIAGTEPIDIQAHGHLGVTGVDEWSAALLKFDGGLSAQITTSVSLNLQNEAIVYGSTGRIRIPNPWLPQNDQGEWAFDLIRGSESQKISGTSPNLYTIEADHVAEQIANRRTESTLLTWQDTLDNALALEAWRERIGLQYVRERPASHAGPILGSLQPATQLISRGKVEHLDKPVARLVMGCDNQPSMSHASVMWDSYFEAGGNCFDTAHIYGEGSMETLLGHWHSQRDLRDEIVIIGKGAHTPNNFPDAIATELDISLERLQTDHIDIYFLHRDNTEIPAAEFIDALNEEVRRGRIRTFGGSNWTLERVIQANEYAAANALQGFSAISNNFSLARMSSPIWPGTETCSSQEFVDYLRQTQMALMPWSSQARGFFTPWADQVIADMGKENAIVTTMQPTIDELKRVWFSQENFDRRDRAAALADKHDVSMINIALAYVLGQSFPTFPLIGPRVLAETMSCIDSLRIELTAEEIDFLENG